MGMGSEPFDENDLSPVVDRCYEPVIVALDVEHHSIRTHNAGRGMLLRYVHRRLPIRLGYLVKPRIECRFNRTLIFVTRE